MTTAVTPTGGATGVSTSVRPTVTFGEAMDASSIGPATFELRDPSNTLVSATITYDAASRTATLAPSLPLAASTTYTALLRGVSCEKPNPFWLATKPGRLPTRQRCASKAPFGGPVVPLV